MTTISGGIFNFTGAIYTPPTLSGGVYNFTSGTGIRINQIHVSEFIFVAGDVGLRVYEQITDELIGFIDYDEGFTTVGSNQSTLFFGTTNSGIKYVPFNTISGSTNSVQDLSTYLEDFIAPKLTSSYIKYLNVKNNQLLACTTAGIDYFRFDTNPEIHSKTSISGAYKCFVTDNSMYYTVSGTNTVTSEIEYSLNKVSTYLADWAEPTKKYITGSGIFEEGLKLNDIFITSNTASQGGNTLFCSTSSGIYIIDEDSGQYAIYYTHTQDI